MLDLNDLSLEQFEAIQTKPGQDDIECDGIVVLPTDEIHESGHRVIEFVTIHKREALFRIAGSGYNKHDVFNLEDQRGTSTRTPSGDSETITPLPEWQCDFLSKSGLLHIWPYCGKLIIGRDTATLHIRVRL